MNEEQWLSCEDPTPMLEFLGTSRKPSERKLRLFGCACVRRLYSHDETEQPTAVAVSERFADGRAGRKELKKVRSQLGARGGYSAAWAANNAIHAVLQDRAAAGAKMAADYAAKFFYYRIIEQGAFEDFAERAAQLDAAIQAERGEQAAILKDVFGNPFREVALDLAWLQEHDIVVKLAQAAYDARIMPAGTLDRARFAVLADALEETGADAVLLEHIRGDGPHVRGCHVIDLLLKKE